MNVNKYKVDILAFGPHPDDVEFGCSGLLLKAKSYGKKTAIVDMSLAELSTNGNVKLRLEEAEEARKIIGATFRENLKIPNNFFYNSKEVQNKIIKAIRKYQPEVVLLPYYFDRHPDHENGSKLIREALFTAGLIKYKTNQKPHRPKHVYYYMMWYDFQPSFVVDITKVYPSKIKAILAYKSQFKLDKNRLETIDNDDRLLKFVEARARNFGFNINRVYGEPYLSINPIGIENPFDLISNFF